MRWLPLAAGLALALLWGRGRRALRGLGAGAGPRPLLRQGEAARAGLDRRTPASSRSGIGSRAPSCRLLPAAAGGVELVGGRYCPLFDRKVAHLYYAGEKRHLSVYRGPGAGALRRTASLTRKAGENVRLLHTGGMTLALVGEDMETVDAFHRALSMTRADASALTPPPGAP